MRTWLLALLLGAAVAQERPRMVVVDIDLLVRPEQAEARLLWVGVEPGQTDGSWLVPGAAARVLEASEPMAVAERWSLALPVVDGLRYFAVLDADGNGRPDRGEGIGGPLDPSRAARGSLTIDRRLGFEDASRRTTRATVPIATPSERRRSDGSTLAPPPLGEGLPATLTLALGPKLAFFDEGRFVVAGFAPGTPWPGGVLPEESAFLWTSEPWRLRWPVTLSAPLPTGLDLVVGLDLDGDGDLGPGDLVARPRPSFVAEATASFVLDRTLPRVRPAPPPEHHDLRPR